MPFSLPGPSNGIAKSPIPTNRALVSGAASTDAAQALVDQSTFSGALKANAWAAPFLNVGAYSGIYRIIPHGVYEPAMVKVNAGTATMQWLGEAGIPIPPDVVPQYEGGATPDSQLFLYSPDDNRGPDNSFLGTYWEFWGLQKLNATDHPTDWAAGYRWSCYQLARMVQANTNEGRMYDLYWQVGGSWEGGPSSDPYAWEGVDPGDRFADATPAQIRALGGDPSRGVWQEGSWGALAIGANPPACALQIHPADILRGYCDHPIGLLIADCESGPVWPAQRSDGTYNHGYPIKEGMWFRFPHDMAMPNNLTPLGELIFRTGRAYENGQAQPGGFLISDKTNTCLAMRANPEVESMLVSPGHDGRDWSAWAFQNFPWSSLKLMTVGSDSNYHPTA